MAASRKAMLVGGALVAAVAGVALFSGEAKAATGPSGGGGGPSPAPPDVKVKDLQIELNALLDAWGYAPLATDGVLGPLTCGAAQWAVQMEAAGEDIIVSDAVARVAESCGTGTPPTKHVLLVNDQDVIAAAAWVERQTGYTPSDVSELCAYVTHLVDEQARKGTAVYPAEVGRFYQTCNG